MTTTRERRKVLFADFPTVPRDVLVAAFVPDRALTKTGSRLIPELACLDPLDLTPDASRRPMVLHIWKATHAGMGPSTVRQVRFALKNDHESPMEIIAEQAGIRRSVAPGQELVVEWTWSGFADLTCGTGWLALSVPAGGSIVVTDPVPADAELWNGVPLPGGNEVREFWIHNATEARLGTFWEPWCGEGDIPPRGGPMRVEWTENSQGVGMIYESDLLVVWDCHGSCRTWRSDGTEVFTGGTIACDPDGEHNPAPVPG